MSGSKAPDPPVRTARRGYYLGFGLIMAIGLILAGSAPRGMPGSRHRGDGNTILCYCGLNAGRMPDGTYACADGHVTEEPKEKKENTGKDQE